MNVSVKNSVAHVLLTLAKLPNHCIDNEESHSNILVNSTDADELMAVTFLMTLFLTRATTDSSQWYINISETSGIAHPRDQLHSFNAFVSLTQQTTQFSC